MPSPKIARFDLPDPDAERRLATEEELARQRALAQALRQQASQTETIANPLQGLNYLAQIGVSGFADRRAERGEQARQEALVNALMGAVEPTQFGLTPEQMAQLVSLNPEMGTSLLGAQMERAMQPPPERWEDYVDPDTGQRGQRSTQSGQINWAPQYVQPGQSEPPPTQTFTLEDGTEELRGWNPQTRMYDIPMGVVGAPPEPERPRIVTGPDEAPYYEDGTPVLPGVQAPPEGPDFTGENQLRNAFNSLTAPFRTVQESYGRVQAAAAEPSAAGDLALIFSFMKILDPGSVVREAEFANAQNAAGVPDQVRNLWNRLLSGERLGPAQREDFVTQAQRLYDAAANNYDQTAAQFATLAEHYGYDPSVIVMPRQTFDSAEGPGPQERDSGPEANAAPTPPPPSIGEVVDGWRFLGGDPSDQNNWEPVQ